MALHYKEPENELNKLTYTRLKPKRITPWHKYKPFCKLLNIYMNSTHYSINILPQSDTTLC